MSGQEVGQSHLNSMRVKTVVLEPKIARKRVDLACFGRAECQNALILCVSDLETSQMPVSGTVNNLDAIALGQEVLHTECDRDIIYVERYSQPPDCARSPTSNSLP